MAPTVSDTRLPADLPDGTALTQVPEQYQPLLDDLFAAIARYNPDADRELITRAFVAACLLHGQQNRKSGEAYIHHPVGTALNAAELKLDSVTIAAALLHDVVEDTGTPLSWIEEQFGDEIAMLVDGVTKLTKMHFTSQEEEQAENYRKMIVAMATDIRVILIKLCDRLHNMHTLCYLSKQKQIQKAKETLEVYAPTSPSRRCTRASTRRSRSGWPSGAPTAKTTSTRRRSSSRPSSTRPASPPTSAAAPSTSTRST
jgi:(p)ppGpp synthase/HD superfamily hydrolase